MTFDGNRTKIGIALVALSAPINFFDMAVAAAVNAAGMAIAFWGIYYRNKESIKEVVRSSQEDAQEVTKTVKKYGKKAGMI